MTALTHAVSVQYPMVATFAFGVADTMKTTAGVSTLIAKVDGIYAVIPLPYGAQVIGGAFTVLTASNDSGTHTVKIGDSVNDDRYSKNTTIDLKTAGATSLPADVGTVLSYVGYQSLGESIQLTFAAGTEDATAGSYILQVMYIVSGRQNENAKIAAPLGYLNG